MQSVVSLFPAVRSALFGALLVANAVTAHADAVVDWNVRANAFIAEARMGTPPAIRVMAIVQTAVHDAIAEIAPGPSAKRPQGSTRASADAAIAAANRAVLVKALPTQAPAIEVAYQASLATITNVSAREAGIAIGERTAAAILAARANDGIANPDTYRPHTIAGRYVVTALPVATQWPSRKPWLLESASQIRPAPPPALTSDVWARDFNEVKALGGKSSAKRSVEQTEVARFWEYSLPSIYHGVVHSVARLEGRTLLQNAELLALVSQAMDDALISVFDAKYHYNFWRPLTAIRNGDIDGNDATERDASWTPFIDTPPHPEYPCAHCILAAAVGTVIKAEIGSGTSPVLATASPTAKGATRRWANADELIREVANARIYDGVHYRNSTEVGIAMGQRIGALAAERLRGASAARTERVAAGDTPASLQ